MAPKAVTGSILQPKHLGMSPLGREPSMASILLAPSPCKPAAKGLWHFGMSMEMCQMSMQKLFSHTWSTERALLQRPEGLSGLAFGLPLGHVFPTL